MGNIFVRRPIFAMVIAIIIVILGAISIKGLPIEQYPDITPPMVEVSAVYQGADAETVEQSVATPIEESVNGVSDMIYMQSVNAGDGTMSLQVTFAVGSDPDMNTVFTENRVSSATPQLPAVVKTQGVTTSKTMGSFLSVISIYSVDGRYDGNFLSNYAMINIKDRIARIDGVGKVQIMGAGQYAMRIWIEPDKLDYMNIGIADIAAAISQQSGIVPGGQLGAEPSPNGTEFTYTVSMPAQYNTAEQFEGIIVRTNADGSLVHLGDIARVELGSQNYGVSSTFWGKPCAVVAIYQSPGSNAVAVGSSITAEMASLSQSFPEGVEYQTVVDSTATIVTGIKEIVYTLIFALVLVVLVIIIFLQNIRAALIPIIAIPVSLIGAFMLFPVFGFSVNVFSLLGLVLAIGLVVDDAIVVVEAVQGNIERGMSAKEATLAAMKSVASPIIATTMVLMAVFLPVALMPGAAGKLYQQFAMTIALAVAISGINALSLSPALCSILLRPHVDKPADARVSVVDRFFGWFNRVFGRFSGRYIDGTRRLLGRSAVSLILIGVLTAVTLGLLKILPTGMLPNEDQGYLIANVQLPNAASLERTEQVMTIAGDIIGSNDNVSAVTAAAGFSVLSNTASSNVGVLFIKLKDWGDRKMKASEIAGMLNGELYEAVNGGQIYVFGPPSIPGLGPGSGFTIMIQDKGDNTPQYLAENADKFVAAASKRPEIASVNSYFEADVPQKAIAIDKAKVLKAGVSLDDLNNVVTSLLGGQYIGNFNRFGKLYQTYIQAESDFRQNEKQIELFFVQNSNGENIPISTFITISDTIGPLYTTRFNLYRSAMVTGTPASGYSDGQTMQALEEVAAEALPADMGYAWSNMSYQEANSSGEAMIFIYAIVFVFLILAALYESWTLPLTIIIGIPLAVFGALSFIYGAYLLDSIFINDIFLQISLIMLIGLAAKNAILIVEFAKDRFDEGMSLADAALAGAKQRLRPILMTAFAFILGIMPLVFATGSNAVARNIMGVALVGGMFIATMVGIYIYPTLYVLAGKVFKYTERRDAAAPETMLKNESNETENK